MRIYNPLLNAARSASTTPSISQPSTAPSWLTTLKLTQLKRIAYLTGTSNSGTKGVLSERLARALEEENRDGGGGDESAPPLPSRSQLVPSSTSRSGDGEMRVLSIDMGIRNLAYAHLLVSPFRDVTPEGKGEEKGGFYVRLDAWNRLAISSFPVQGAEGSGDGTIALEKFNGGIMSPGAADSTTTTTAAKKSKGKSPKSRFATASEDAPLSNDQDISDTAKEVVAKESFAPHIYASHAYTLITNLVSTYKPTHILIERQRFRSGGGVAVQEWTIRVGVFEAMLYAVLQTLKSESRKRRMALGVKDETNTVEDVIVLGVDPRRVANYWIEKMRVSKPNIKLNSKDGKKVKIDVIKAVLVGKGGPKLLSMAESSTRVTLGDSAQVRDLARAFLKKLKGKTKADGGETTTKKKTEATQEPEEPEESVKAADIDIGKLDDLADCFLQGLTWLCWRDMRERIAKGGFEAVPFEVEW